MMKRIFRNSLIFLDYPQGSILSAGYVIMVLYMLNGLFSILRSRLLTSYFTSDLGGIYFAAFVIPDNMFQILIVSAMGTAFIPVFTRYQKSGQQWEVTQAVLTTSLIIFAILTAIIALFAKPLSFLLVPGIQKYNPAHIELLVNLTRIILFSQLFFVFSYIATGVLQSYKRFIIPALAPIFYNIGIIMGMLFLAPIFGMYGVAIGIVMGAFLHLAIQLPFILRLGFQLKSSAFNPFHPSVKEILFLMGPRVLSTAIERTKITIDTFLSSLISLQSIEYLNFALQAATFPVSLVGAAIAQAALPFFTKSVADNNIAELRKHILLSLTHIVFLLAPFSVLLIVFHTPITRLVFGGPLLPWAGTVLTARTLAIFSISIVALGVNNILARAFYALLDTKTPLIITSIATAIAVALSVIFVQILHLDVESLAAAATISAFVNAIALFILLHKRVGELASLIFFGKLAKIIGMSFVLGIVAYAALKLLERYFNTIYTIELFLFTLLATLASGLCYLLLSIVFDLQEYKELFLLFKKAASIRQAIFAKSEENV